MNAPVTCLVDKDADLSEGIIWDAENARLYWVDIPGFTVYSTDPATGATQGWNIGQHAGFAAVRTGGGLIVAARDGVFLLDTKTGELTTFADPEPDKPENRFNDGCVDPAGRLWAGTMPIAGQGPEPYGALYRIDPDGTTSKWMDNMFVCNGLAFSPDGATMYVADTGKKVLSVYAFDYDVKTGTPSNKRVYLDLRERNWSPDGGTVDSEGFYWAAIVNDWKIARFSPDGALDRVIDMPIERPTKPVIVDGTLYATSLRLGLTPGSEGKQPQAGAVFRVDVGVDAPPHPRFAG